LPWERKFFPGEPTKTRDAETYHPDGSIDELRIHIRPLSETEVKELFQQTVQTGQSTAHELAEGNVYPNPAGDRLFVNLPSRGTDPAERFIVMDITGNWVLVHPPDESVDLSGLPGGFYLLVVESALDRKVYPFVRTQPGNRAASGGFPGN
jgi:hypothetical protein